MQILFALTYYRPHVSGLTVFAGRLAEALAARGHAVTVLTSRHETHLPQEETLDGVRVVRAPVAFRVSKGAVMPSYLSSARRELRRGAGVVVAHLPSGPSEAVLLPILARLRPGLRFVAVYYCDLRLPGGLFSRALDAAAYLNNSASCALADRVVTLTQDYADHSPLLRRFRHKLEIIRPGVLVESADAAEVEALRRRYAPRGERLVGVAARFAAEKGIEHLLAALPRVREQVGDVRVLFTGDPERVVGEEEYWSRMKPSLERAGDRVAFLGQLGWRQLAAFYRACDVTVLPSTNSTEAFGLVQLESMLAGTPVVASDLPGVRVPLRETGMGLLVPPGDASALAAAIVRVLRERESFVRPREEVERKFSFERMVGDYEALFESVIAARRGGR